MSLVLSILWIQFLIIPPILGQEQEIARVFSDADVSSYSEATTSFLEWIEQAADPNIGDPEALKWHQHWIALITPEETTAHQSAHLLIAGMGVDKDAEEIVT